jgi:CRP-like cAMP-binding protein
MVSMKMTARARADAIVAETATHVPAAASSNRSATADALFDAPLFAGMERAEVASALASFDEVRFPSGRRVVLERLRGSDFFLVMVGTAGVEIDGRRVATLGPGDFFGEMAVLGDGLRTASVRALTPLHCVVLPNGKLQQLILDHPQVGVNLLHTVVARVTQLAGHRRQAPFAELMGA